MLWGSAQEGGGVSILQDFVKLTGQGLEKGDLALWLALLGAEGWTRDLWWCQPTCLL